MFPISRKEVVIESYASLTGHWSLVTGNYSPALRLLL